MGPNQLSLSTVVAFLLALMIASGLAGALIGDRWQPFGTGPTRLETKLDSLSIRLEALDTDYRQLKSRVIEGESPKPATDVGKLR